MGALNPFISLHLKPLRYLHDFFREKSLPIKVQETTEYLNNENQNPI